MNRITLFSCIVSLSLAIGAPVLAQNSPAATTPSVAAPALVTTPAIPTVKAKVKAPAAQADTGGMKGTMAYYSRKFNGKKTANGERFNSKKMTMAHRTLPFGSLVRVTNTQTKKSVVVRVNDRGPSTPDRIGDVTRAAAVKLGMIKNGTAEVTLKVVGKKAKNAISKGKAKAKRKAK
jgi:rare lipoprotein A